MIVALVTFGLLVVFMVLIFLYRRKREQMLVAAGNAQNQVEEKDPWTNNAVARSSFLAGGYNRNSRMSTMGVGAGMAGRGRPEIIVSAPSLSPLSGAHNNSDRQQSGYAGGLSSLGGGLRTSRVPTFVGFNNNNGLTRGPTYNGGARSRVKSDVSAYSSDNPYTAHEASSSEEHDEKQYWGGTNVY